MSNSSIWPIERTLSALSGATTLSQSGLGRNDNKGDSTFPKAPGLEPHPLIV